MNKLILMIAVLLLGACATTPSFQQQMDSFRAEPEDAGKRLLVVYVPSAGNPISNGMMVGTLETGLVSNAAQQIINALSSPNVVFAVMGKLSRLMLPL